MQPADHFIQQHAHGPEVRLSVDVPRLEALGREVGDAAKVVARDFPAQRKGFGDPEVQDFYLVVLENADVSRLEIAVQKRAKLPAVDRGFKAVRGLEKITELDGDPDGTYRRQRTVGDDFGKVPPFQILHRDIEICFFGVVLVHGRNVPTRATELLLKLRPPALGIEDVTSLPVISRRHNLQRHAAIRPAVDGEEHDGHAPTPDLLENLVRSDPLKHRRHHRPRRPRGTVEGVERGS